MRGRFFFTKLKKKDPTPNRGAQDIYWDYVYDTSGNILMGCIELFLIVRPQVTIYRPIAYIYSNPASWESTFTKTSFATNQNFKLATAMIELNGYGNGSKNTFISTPLSVDGVITSGGSQVLTVTSALANRFLQASSTGVINLTGSTPGLTANNSSIFSLNAAGKVSYASNRPLAVTSTTPSTSSSTGALTVDGGLGAAMDSDINGVRIGRGAGNITTNTALGSSSLNANTTGSGNSAFGAETLLSNTTGYSNLAVGAQALHLNTTGASNSSFGVYSLRENLTGGSNVAVGDSAGRYCANGTALTDPERSVYIGVNSRAKDNSDDNSIVIGTNAIGLGANTSVIGNAATTRTHLHGLTTTSSLEISGNTELKGQTKTASLEVLGNTSLNGQVTLGQPQGDISMGIYQ